MKKIMTKMACLVLMSLISVGLFAQADAFKKAPKETPKEAASKEARFMREVVADTYGPAPVTNSVAHNTQSELFRSVTSEALVALGGDALSHFILNDPAGAIPYGTTAPEFMNSAEYYGGTYYFASSTSGLLGTIDPTTGEVTQLMAGNPFASIAYNPADGLVYGIVLGASSTLYTVDLNALTYSQVVSITPTANFLLGLAISNDGRFFVIDAEIDGISELDPTTGALTTVWASGFIVNYGQDIACDRESNTIYWAAYNATAGAPELYMVDVNAGSGTLIGTFSDQAAGFATLTIDNPNLAAAPTNFVATPDPNQGLSASLSWTNPTVTVGGTALTSITKMVLKRNGAVIQEFTGTTPGANLTYTDNVTEAGTYSYSVSAVTTEGNGLAAGATAVIGPMCTFMVTGTDGYGDGWNGAAIQFQDENGVSVASFAVSGAATTKEFTLPSNIVLNCIWIAGTFDGECAFEIYDAFGAVIYTSSGTPTAGLFFTFINSCSLTVPNSPTNFVATPDPNQGLSASLSWTNPTATIGGTALTSITKVVLKRDGAVIQEFTSTTPGANLNYTDNVPEAGVYSYTVYAVNTEGDGLPAVASAVIGPMCTFTVAGTDGYGDGWNGASIQFQDENGVSVASFTVLGAETTTEYTLPSNILLNCIWISGTFDAECAFVIYDAFDNAIYTSSGTPTAGSFFTFINSCSFEIPSLPTNFVVTPDPNNGLSATLTWTNPTACLNGSALTMISATIKRNGETIHTINNPTNGANETYVDNVPTAAMYTYSVFVTNAAGNSGVVSATVGVGGIYQMVVGQTVEITTCSGIIFDNGGASGQYANSSNDIMIINPATPGARIAISGTYVIEGNYDFLYVYDGSGTSGTLLNTYSLTAGGNISDVSNSGPLTLHFTSDASVPKDGFEISVSCVTSTSVSGTVTKLSNGSPIAGATVTLTGTGGGTATTNASGNYTVTAISGTFNVSVTADGYNSISETGFVVPESGVTGKNFQMTAPTISVAPTAVTITAPYMGTGTANVTVSNTGNGPLTWSLSSEYRGENTPARAPWDLVATFSATAGGVQAVATDGNFIYLAAWGSTAFEKYDMDLNFVEGFNIASVTGTRDLTYDGQYFYCGAAASTLYCLDLANKTLVSSVPTAVSAIRHCTYDPANDGFWVGDWATLSLIDRSGAILISGPAPTSAYGSGYDNVSDGGPYLLLFCQPNSDAKVFRYNINNNVIEPSPIFDFSVTPGFDAAIAGGAFVGVYNGLYCFFGNVQQTPNLIGIYELGSAGWMSANPSSGTIAAGSTQTVAITGNAADMNPGTYNGTASFKSSSPDVGTANVAVTFIVEPANCGQPQNVAAVSNATDMDIDVTWSAVTDALSYKVYVNGTLAGTVTTNSYTYTNVEYDEEYCFYIIATCSLGDGIPSATVCANVIPTPIVCNPPTNLAALTNGSNINLTWVAPTDRDVLLNETFETGSLPSGWLAIDADGDGYNWDAVTGFNLFVGHSGGQCISSSSYDNNVGALTPNNYLITPMVAGASSVNYWVCSQDAAYSYEHYGVCASSTGINASDFTVVFEETMTPKGAKYEGERGTRAQGAWYERTVNLPAGTKYIAFRHFNCTDAFWLNLDDVTVYGGGGPVVKIYNVYRDGVKIASNVEGEAYINTNLSNGTYCYKVTQVCGAEESNFSNEACATVGNVIELNNVYTIYPNPANNKVIVDGENIESIAIYNIVGQMVDNIKVVSSSSQEINTSSYDNGFYIFRINTTDGNVIQKRIVIAH